MILFKEKNFTALKKPIRLLRLFSFFFILLPSSVAFSQSNAKLKFVFPFGEGLGKGSISVCQTAYQTENGCCEPPNTAYVYDLPNKKACCEPPNAVSTVGTKTRCCVPEGLGQTRYSQTQDFPCGQFCSFPSAVSHAGTNSACCAPEGAGQSRWDQTAAFPCGQFCSQPSLVIPFGAQSSCCPACGGFRSFSSAGRICGTCCPTPYDCGDSNVAVYGCDETTGAGACSVISPCNEDGRWLSSVNGSLYSCHSKPNPCPGYGGWNAAARTWSCYTCYRNGAYYAQGSCACTGPQCTSLCQSFGAGGGGGTVTCSFAAVYFIEEGMNPQVKGWIATAAWSDTTKCCNNYSPGIPTSIINVTSAGMTALNPWTTQKNCAMTCTSPTHADLGPCFTSALTARTCTSYLNRLFTFGQMSLYYCTAQCNADCYTVNPFYSCSTSVSYY